MKVLVGYDGSECARAALNDLRRAGLPQQGEMVVLCAADVSPHLDQQVLSDADDWQLKAVKEARKLADIELEGAEEIASQGAEDLSKYFPEWLITTEAALDPPHWAIVNKADEWHPDLIVLGSHGRSALGRIFMGSVSHNVLAHSKSSVRIGRPPLNRKHEHGRILIGVDGSAGSAAAVSAVISRRWPKFTEARIVAVIDSAISTSLPVMGLAEGKLPVPCESPHDWILHALKQVAKQLKDAGIFATPLVCTGDPKKGLLDEAARWEASCIFVGAKGLSQLDRFVLGSVSMAVASRAHRSVEVIR